MRFRLVLLVVAILLVAGFAALNWSEVIRPAPLLFGPFVADAPLGAILLGALALALVAFLLSAASMRTQSLLESRHHYKELEAQRLLADKAEASRFTELRQYLDTNLREIRDRDATLSTEWQRELRAQMEQTNRMMSARLNELEHRLESRFERMGHAPVRPAVVPGVAPVRQEPVVPASSVQEHAFANDRLREEQLRDRQAQLREEERLRDERLRADREQRRDEKAAATDRPEAGWRRWF